jgi:hypothetical protein
VMAPLPLAPRRADRTPMLIGALVAVFLLAVGGAGLYLAHANGSNANSLAQGTATATPSPTPVPSPTPTPGEAVTYTSSLIGAQADWPNDTHCSARSDGYHVQIGYICVAPIGNLGDGRVTVQVEAVSGPANDLYGLVLRASDDGKTLYLFGVDTNGQWAFANCTSSGCTAIEDFTLNPVIHRGLKVFNTISIDARGAHFTFYVNGHQVGETDDTAYTSGKVGLVAGVKVTAVFRHITVAQPQ